MYLDAIDLKNFYSTPLGNQTQTKLAAKIAHVWPKIRGERLLGLGYPTPYLAPFLSDADHVLGFMPAQQGVFRWPDKGACLTSLVHETMLPLYDHAIDRILLVHSLEMTDNPRELLSELWRVLSPGGRLLIVVPNRTGLWARIENTPFGYGRPFSRGQLTQLLRDAMFSPIGWVSALHTPPSERRSFLTSRWMENGGERYWPRLSGAFLMEATKIVVQGIPAKTERAFKPAFKPVLVPSPQPSASSSRKPHV